MAPTTAPDATRKNTINRLFTGGQVSTRDILTADFGNWPPKDLSIIQAPDIPVTFSKMFSRNPLFTGYTDNAMPQNIHVNIWSLLPRIFNRASASLTELVSHENIHVIQNILTGTVATHPEKDHPNSYRDYITNIIPPPYLQSVAHLREAQPRLHGVIAEHYRRRQVLPGNTVELFALLRAEKIIIDSAYVDDLLDNSFEGRWARKKFPADSGRQGIRTQDAADLWLLLSFFMKKEKRDEFYEKILPGIYGKLLELYGDEFGCMRMGYNYNTLMNEILLRQARENDRAGMEKTVTAMPLSQAGALMNDLARKSSWTDKTTGHIHKITPERAEILINLLYKHTAPPDYRSRDLQIRP